MRLEHHRRQLVTAAVCECLEGMHRDSGTISLTFHIHSNRLVVTATRSGETLGTWEVRLVRRDA
jgi:hypothetical protein